MTAKRSRPSVKSFSKEMEQVIPWQVLPEHICPHYYLSGSLGRQPIAPEVMLRIYFLQQWYTLSDPGAEDALIDIHSMSRFVGVAIDEIPDETTILNFRHLLEKHNLTKSRFDLTNKHLEEKGLILKQFTLVDASIIHAFPSTKNKENKRDADMSSTKKGNQWYFGMKAHIGMDHQHRIVHTLETSTAKEHDSQYSEALLHGAEETALGDKAYSSNKRSVEDYDGGVLWLAPIKSAETKQEPRYNKDISTLRSRVEHAFHTIKCIFGYRKVGYKGLGKNTAQLYSLFMLANLYRVRRQLTR